MQLFKIADPSAFDAVPEAGMGFHFAAAPGGGVAPFLVVGGEVAVRLREPLEPLVRYLDHSWLRPGALAAARREELFREWVKQLPEAPQLQPLDAPREIVLAAIIGIAPLAPLPSPPRPTNIYGHLPFAARTDAETIIYRWEAFPVSRRILRRGASATILADTYAAPASEPPFAVTGFAALARFALPNLLPACFRWELQPVPGPIECGASVPLYGQSGGGVEVRFPHKVATRCPVADPVLLPAL